MLFLRNDVILNFEELMVRKKQAVFLRQLSEQVLQQIPPNLHQDEVCELEWEEARVMNEPYRLLTKIPFAALLIWQPESMDQIFKDGSRNNF